MSGSARLINPWVFNFQKLGLELKCPLCLNLLNKPVLLPCNHVFCNSCVPAPLQFSANCPACQQHFTHQEIRPASHMENIVAFYKSLDSSFNSSILPLLSTDSGNPLSLSNSVDQLRKNQREAAPKGQLSHTVQITGVSNVFELTKCSVSEELDANHAPEMSPGTSPSSSEDVKLAVHKSEPCIRSGGTKNCVIKKRVGDNLARDADDAFRTIELKRQKKLVYGLPDSVLQKRGHRHQVLSDEDQISFSNYDEHYKPKQDMSVVPSISPNTSGSVCAFCHSSKITEGTGPMLHYADGKEVAKDETLSPKAIPVHSKCIEWTPKVYFVGETIKNLESELSRASKLKCSNCGLKGAALGCFVKSCKRSYHVPCALEVPNCRWDCGEFLLLCPVHTSIKFPSEKSKSRKGHSEQKPSLPIQIASEELSFWASSSNGPREWVFCGSALSSKDKCLLVKFATMCGATVFKFWNPNVTHVIAATDSIGACSRTLKVLMGILNGRWILTMDWIKACMEANCYVDEAPFEVNLDNHGCGGGPKSGRLRASNNAGKLFTGLNFYFHGDFVPSYKSDLLDLVRVGGGAVIESLEKKMTEQKHDKPTSSTLVVYYNDNPRESVEKEVISSLAEAEDLCKDMDAEVIPHTWILQSIAACRVLPPC